MDKRIKYRNGELRLACLIVQCNSQYGVRNDVYISVVRSFSPVHFWLAVSVVKIILERSFVPPLPFAKPLEKSLFSAMSRWRVPFALAFGSHVALWLKERRIQSHVSCACCKQCTLLRDFSGNNQLFFLWPKQLPVVVSTYNDASCDVEHSRLTL